MAQAETFQIQGDGPSSPFLGKPVISRENIVTRVGPALLNVVAQRYLQDFEYGRGDLDVASQTRQDAEHSPQGQ